MSGLPILHTICQVIFSSKIKNKSKCTDLVSGNVANVLIPFHVITGCDHTSGFHERGKKSVFGKVQKDKEAQELLQKVGKCLKLSDNVRDDIRLFVLLKIYGGKETTCTEARAAKWRKKKKKSLVGLPPDEDTSHHHLDQVSYLSYFLKHYKLNRHPSPIGRGWEHIKGKCRPVRYAIPATADVLQSQMQALSGNDDDNESNGEYGDNSDDCDIDSK